MREGKSRQILTLTIVIAAVLVGVLFIMNDDATARTAPSGSVLASAGSDERRPFGFPFFRPFFFDREDFFFAEEDEFFFERRPFFRERENFFDRDERDD